MLLVSGVGYVLGSIPSAVIIARYRGVNIFEVGSGNAGATNVKRVLGKTAGNLCFALDFLKGTLAAGWPMWVFSQQAQTDLFAVLGLIAAIFGHRFSLFINFRGGKGVATTMGGLMAVMPLVSLIGVSVWLVVFLVSRYVSVASLAFALTLPISVYCFNESNWYMLLSVLLAVQLFISHRSNLVRLAKGEEHRFNKKRGCRS